MDAAGLALLLDLDRYQSWLQSPVAWLMMGFQLWMLVDAVRRQEWIWAVLILLFSVLTALLYFLLVYRPARAAAGPGPALELPGSSERRRIRELQAQIHHLDKAHHHAELGEIHMRQGRLEAAEKSLRAAVERDPSDLDFQASLGICLMKQGRFQEAASCLEPVCKADPKHDYGQTQMALGECLAQAGNLDSAALVLEEVLQSYSYPRARVQLAEVYLKQQRQEAARAQLEIVISDERAAVPFQRARDRSWTKRARKLLSSIANRPSTS